MEARPVKYSEDIAPFCPVCGSGEYMTNEDGNENEYCGQCGTRLDWQQWENIDTEEIVQRRKTFTRCKNCKYFEALPMGKGALVGNCPKKPKKNPRYGSTKACKQFVNRVWEG